jgi:hypothetical protein
MLIVGREVPVKDKSNDYLELGSDQQAFLWAQA